MAGGAEEAGARGGGALFAFVFPMFVTVSAFAVLVLVKGVFVLFVLAAVLVFFPLVFAAAAAAVMFGPLLCLLAVGFCLLLDGDEKTHQPSS